MSMEDLQLKENIAATLARVLPEAKVVLNQSRFDDDGEEAETDAIVHVAIPKGFDLKEIDTEGLLTNPRRAKSTAVLNDADSFIAYVNRHASASTVVWCGFNPQTFALSFTAVIDEHAGGLPGWRTHKASYTPAMSVEWKTWSAQNAKAMEQLEFAEFLESNENDIAAVDGMPTSLQMHALATEFVARQDLAIKSVVRTQNGGVQLNYVNDADAGTTEAMKVFDKFVIGIPVFWTAPEAGPGAKPIDAFRLDARLKYKLGNGKVKFHYELIRPDRVHQKAAVELIESIRSRLLGTTANPVPLLLGNCA